MMLMLQRDVADRAKLDNEWCTGVKSCEQPSRECSRSSSSGYEARACASRQYCPDRSFKITSPSAVFAATCCTVLYSLSRKKRVQLNGGGGGEPQHSAELKNSPFRSHLQAKYARICSQLMMPRGAQINNPRLILVWLQDATRWSVQIVCVCDSARAIECR